MEDRSLTVARTPPTGAGCGVTPEPRQTRGVEAAMNKTLLTIGLLAALALPAHAAAKPTKTDRRHAAKECRAERGTSEASREAFAAKYKTFGHCVSRRAREEQAERRKARSNAAKECKAERADEEFPASHDGKSFNEYYGTNPNGSNAFGKCVSSKARAKKLELDEADEDDEAETPKGHRHRGKS
jgi:hypothetical protein